MKIISDNEKIDQRCAVCLGNFDGIHIGHQKIIETLCKSAEKENLKTVMLTFKIHPENYMRNGCRTKLITGEEIKLRLLSDMGLDMVCLHEFNEETKRLSPEAFVKGVLIDRLCAGILVAGFNYRFGRDRAGDAETLTRIGGKYGAEVIIVPAVCDKGRVVSSTLVREQLENGDIEEANRLLNRKYAITGEVGHGKKRGGTLGFPTANLVPVPELKYPRKGVYVTKTYFGSGEDCISVTNIGINPTMGGEDKVIETHMIDRSAGLYHTKIKIEFYKKIRDEVTFGSVDDLREQIRKDIEYTVGYFQDMGGTAE